MKELNKKNVEDEIKRRFKALVKGIDGKEIRVGIKGGKTNKGQDIATYGAMNEFGSFSKNIPARPFLRTTFAGEGEKKITERSFKAIQESILNDYDTSIALDKIAEQGAIMVRENIRKGQWTPNRPSTLARKKGTKPLIDTGSMIGSIEGWVEKNANS